MILLDAAMGERPGWATATLLIDETAHEDVRGYVCAGSLEDVYCILTKYADEKAAREFTLTLMDFFGVVAIEAALWRPKS